MATLALTTVGNALGGPIGGAIGGLIGQGIDRSLFGPGPRRGPRLNDLSIQTSSYGSQIPRIYGRMRVAGSVVWATELKESSEPAGGAKGQPDVIVYSYSASFAVALSSRAAKGVERIWADGKLLRGAAGDFKVKTGFRFYPGDEDQPIDPLIASVEGIERATAFRGLALCVFEDLQLSEFGNRLPFLTFEILADEADPTLGEILNDVGGEVVECQSSETVIGFAAYGANRRAAMQPLVDQFSVHLFDDGEHVRTPIDARYEPSSDELGCEADAEGGLRTERSQVSARALPKSLALAYYDPDRDYQLGQMRASAAASLGAEESVELPVVLEAERAKGLAESHIARRWAERDRLTLRLSPESLAVEPGSLISADGAIWRVEQATIEGLAVKVELSRVADRVAAIAADPGRGLPAPDVVAAPTVLVVLDLPDLGTGRHDVPVLHVAACQPAAGWRPVAVEVTSGGEVRTVASAAGEAVIGTVLTVPGETVEVELADADHWLESRDDAALANGANLAAIGSEIVQFASAVAIGPKRFRLSGLLRGRIGTDYSMDAHSAGELFVLLKPGTLQEIAFPPSAIGSTASIKARGLADDDATAVERVITGEGMRPPSPVDLQADVQAGALSLAWTRRSRSGWFWPAESELPLGESSERYRISVEGAAGTLTLQSAEPQITISAEALAGMTGDVTVNVVQLGDYAESRPATTTVTL